MDPGEMTKRVACQRNQTALDDQDATGQVNEANWTTFASRWAKLEPLTGREVEIARQQVATATHRITLRAPGLTLLSTDRILFGSRVYEIGHVMNPDEYGEFLVVLATERAREVA